MLLQQAVTIKLGKILHTHTHNLVCIFCLYFQSHLGLTTFKGPES